MFGLLFKCLFVLYCLILSVKSSVYIENSSALYFQNPSYPLKGFNFTLGVLADITYGPFVPNEAGIFQMLGTICEAYKYNENRGLVNISGTFNVQGMNTRSQTELTYYAAMQLLQTTLSSDNETLRKQIDTRFPALMGAQVGSSRFSLFAEVAPYFEGFEIPVIDYTSLSDYSLRSSAPTIFYKPFGESIYTINPSSSPDLFETIISFMVQMNWTLSGIIFEESTFGQLGIQYVDSAKSKNVTFVCSQFAKIQPGNEETFSPFLAAFHKCITRFDEIKVIVLWMSYANGVATIRTFEELGYTGYTFIIAYKQASFSDPESEEFKELLKYNFFFTTALDPPPENEILSCLKIVVAESHRKEEEFALRLVDFLRETQRCELYSTNETLEVCDSEVQDATKKCVCTVFNAYNSINESLWYYYAADAVSTIAQGIYLL